MPGAVQTSDKSQTIVVLGRMNMDSILELQLPGSGSWTKDCTILYVSYCYEVWGYVPIDLVSIDASNVRITDDVDLLLKHATEGSESLYRITAKKLKAKLQVQVPDPRSSPDSTHTTDV